MSTDHEAAIKAAMIAELGNIRLEALPMEDGEGRTRGPHGTGHVTNRTLGPSSISRLVPVNKKWGEAIESGAFEDDDAAQVSGMDTMASGNLARQRRAQNVGSSRLVQNYTEQSLGRDANGHVTPRTSFAGQSRGARRVSRKLHAGNDPIDVDSVIRSAHRAGLVFRTSGLPRQVNKPTRERSQAEAPPPVASSWPTSNQTAQGEPKKQEPSEPGSEDSYLTAQSQVRAAPGFSPVSSEFKALALPDGASVVLQVSGTIQSTALAQRTGMDGRILLVEAQNRKEDMVLFLFQDKSVAQIRHPSTEYTDYMTKDNGLMLLFTTESGCKLFYAVVLESIQTRDSFIRSLQAFMKRREQDTEAASLMLKENIAPLTRPHPRMESQPSTKAVPSKHSAHVVKFYERLSLPMNTTEASKEGGCSGCLEPPTSRQPGPPVLVKSEVIQEIVACVKQTVRSMQENAPNSVSFDVIRVIIKATITAIVTQRYPNIRQLNTQAQAEIMDTQCLPAVEKGFLRELAQDTTLMSQLSQHTTGDDPVTRADDSLARSSQCAWYETKIGREPPLPKYNKDELFSMRPGAIAPDEGLLDFDEIRKGGLGTADHPAQQGRVLEKQAHKSAMCRSHPVRLHQQSLQNLVDSAQKDIDRASSLDSPGARVEPRAVYGGYSAQTSGPTSFVEDWQAHPKLSYDHDQVEKFANFMAGRSGDQQKKPFPSPPYGLTASRHNPAVNSQTYSQQLSSAFETDLNREVAQTTEGFRKLSLGS